MKLISKSNKPCDRKYPYDHVEIQYIDETVKYFMPNKPIIGLPINRL